MDPVCVEREGFVMAEDKKVMETPKENQAKPKHELQTTLTNAASTFLPVFERQMEESNITLGSYAKQCAYATVIALNRLVQDNCLSWNELDKSNIVDIITSVAGMELNPNAQPREVYFTLRNKKIKKVDPNTGHAVEGWVKMVEMGIEGDGNDAILSRFGRNVSMVHRHWVVRENDEFTYPSMDGLTVTPPKWTPKGGGQCVRVVYPITLTDGTTEYYICERYEVLNNLFAHISNNMMNETFGICADRFKANAEQKKQIAAKKKEYMDKAKEKGFEVLDDPEFEPWISSAWRSEYSRESMIIRKMRNNIVKKIPKDFSIPQGAISYSQSEEGGFPSEKVIETDFEEVGITQSRDEKNRLEELNQSLGA